jgi:signal peptidase I
VFQQSKIPSGSMMDTLLIGDYIMVNRFVYANTSFGWERALLPIRPVRFQDVVVFKQPDEPETDFIKRVVGLPGDVVALRDGYLHVNGKKIDEPYVKDEHRRADPQKNFPPVTVKPDYYFMMGDHRNESADSRIWGQVHRDLLKGRALLVWWSFNEQDGRGDPYPSLGERLKSWTYKLRHFVSESRWKRCFRLIR